MRRLGGAAAAAATVIILLTGCGTQTTPSTVTPSVTVAPSSPLPTVTVTAAPTPSASASRTASTAASASASSATPAGDSGAPADQCPDADLGVSISIADGGGGAGSEYYNVLFTNVGGSSCVLRGTPGVSVVGGGSGKQVGPAADRIQTGVKPVRLGVGETAAAPLRIVNIGTDGGPLVGCTVAKGDGYRVYPPHSKKAFFVEDADAVACTGGPVFMTASPVIRFTD